MTISGYWYSMDTIFFSFSFLVAEVPQDGPAIESTNTTRARPSCSLCKKPMKGHKNVADCPKNRKT